MDSDDVIRSIIAAFTDEFAERLYRIHELEVENRTVRTEYIKLQQEHNRLKEELGNMRTYLNAADGDEQAVDEVSYRKAAGYPGFTK